MLRAERLAQRGVGVENCLDKSCHNKYNGGVNVMPPAVDDLALRGPNQAVARLVFHLMRHLATALDREVAAYNLTAQQAAVLLRLGTEGETRPTWLALRVGTDNA